MDEEAIANALAKRFIARHDVMALQDSHGAYRPIEKKFTRGALREHVRGEVSLGHYLLDANNDCKLFAYDLDLTKTGSACDVDFGPFETKILRGTERPCNPREEFLNPESLLRGHLALQLHALACGLAWRIKKTYGFDAIVSYSGGKGLHVYGLCGKRPAADCRAMAIALLETWTMEGGDPLFEPTRGEVFWRRTGDEYKCVDIEVFPKQDKLDKKGYGNLMRLPYGVNARSGQRAYFVEVHRTPQRHELFSEELAMLALDKGSVRGQAR